MGQPLRMVLRPAILVAYDLALTLAQCLQPLAEGVDHSLPKAVPVARVIERILRSRMWGSSRHAM